MRICNADERKRNCDNGKVDGRLGWVIHIPGCWHQGRWCPSRQKGLQKTILWCQYTVTFQGHHDNHMSTFFTWTRTRALKASPYRGLSPSCAYASSQFLKVVFSKNFPYPSNTTYYPGQKNWDKHACKLQARACSRDHAPVPAGAWLSQFFGQGSSCIFFRAFKEIQKKCNLFSTVRRRGQEVELVWGKQVEK